MLLLYSLITIIWAFYGFFQCFPLPTTPTCPTYLAGDIVAIIIAACFWAIGLYCRIRSRPDPEIFLFLAAATFAFRNIPEFAGPQVLSEKAELQSSKDPKNFTKEFLKDQNLLKKPADQSTSRSMPPRSAPVLPIWKSICAGRIFSIPTAFQKSYLSRSN